MSSSDAETDVKLVIMIIIIIIKWRFVWIPTQEFFTVGFMNRVDSINLYYKIISLLNMQHKLYTKYKVHTLWLSSEGKQLYKLWLARTSPQ